MEYAEPIGNFYLKIRFKTVYTLRGEVEHRTGLTSVFVAIDVQNIGRIIL